MCHVRFLFRTEYPDNPISASYFIRVITPQTLTLDIF